NPHTSAFTAIGVESTPADLTALMDVSATTHTNGGTYTADVWSFAGNNNYNTANGTVDNAIGKIMLTVTVDPASKNCGESDPILTGTLTGNIPQDGITATYTRTAGETVAGSPYTISATLVPVNALDNYNISYTTAIFTIEDTTAPVIASLPQSTTIDCNATPQFTQATATDCSPFTLTFLDTTNPGACAGSYSITRTWTATDDSGNNATASQTINVQDVIAPVIAVLPGVSTIECSEILTFAKATATDSCGSDFQLTFNDLTNNGECTGSYSVTRTWTAIDSCGNTSTASQTIIVKDTTAPVFVETLPTMEITVNCDQIPTAAKLTAIDNCSGSVPVIFTEKIINVTSASYSIIRKWNATDPCNNKTEFIQIINVTVSSNVITVSSSACNANPAAVDLNSLLPEGTPTGGIWIGDNTGTLQGSIFTSLGVPLGNYHFEYKINTAACPRSVVINMTVNDDCDKIVLGCGIIEVHNAFSPNGDGINETFTIDNITDTSCYPENTLEIYNRFGILVYKTQNYNNSSNAFDGKSNVKQSSDLPKGTYFYILNYTSLDGNNKIQINKKDGYLYLTR
ncbi:T9SS type B sorting domain-containing protein, partial [Flavobacterium granuli]